MFLQKFCNTNYILQRAHPIHVIVNLSYKSIGATAIPGTILSYKSGNKSLTTLIIILSVIIAIIADYIPKEYSSYIIANEYKHSHEGYFEH